MTRLSDIEAITADRKDKERDYWLNKLSGDLAKVYFPADSPYKDEQGGTQRQSSPTCYSFTLEGELFAQLIKISKNSVPRLFVLLLTAINALLNRYTGNCDIIVGAPVVKQESEAEFINTVLILRNHPHPDMTFKELLLSVRQTVMEAAQHQNYPLNTLLYELNVPTFEETDQTFPLFDIALLLENIHDRSYIRHIPVNMLIVFNLDSQCIKASVEYNASIYRTETIRRTFAHFVRLLASGLSHPDLPLSHLDILAPEEKRRLLQEFNRLTVRYPKEKKLWQLFAEQVEKTPDNIALTGPLAKKYRSYMTYISYRELNKKSNQLAYYLLEKGVKRDNIVGIMVERSIEMIIGILAILKADAAYLPINPDYPEERKQYMLKDSGAKILLTQQEIADLSSPQAFNNRPKGSPSFGIWNLEFGISPQQGGQLAYIIYTSGSTGKSKGVMIEHSNVHNLVIGLKETIYKHYNGILKVCLIAPYEFDASVQQIFGALLQGHILYIVPAETRLDGAKLLEFYRVNRIDISDGTPSHMRLLLEALDSMSRPVEIPVSHFIIAGEAFPRKVVESFFKDTAPGPQLSNLYGPTETCVDSSFFHINAHKIPSLQVLPIGKPLPNQQVFILDIENQLLPIGVPGELCIGGDGVARGYLNNPGLTSEKFDQDLWDYPDYHDEKINQKLLWGVQGGGFLEKSPPGRRRLKLYKTGDLARWQSDGNIEFLGRIDTQIKIRGFRIEPGEIEGILLKNNKIKEAVVAARKDKNGDKYLCAYIVSDKKFEVTELREYLTKELPGYMIPSFFVQLEKMPLTANGKVNQEALEMVEITTAKQDGYVGPENETQEQLMKIWAEVLLLEESGIGIDANFFELGGNSLNIIQVNNKIKEVFQEELEVVTLFSYPTIRSLAGYLHQSNGGENLSPKENILQDKTLEKFENSMKEAVQLFEGI